MLYIPEEVKNHERPKIGVALSGASGRAVAHAGVLEVLEDYGIPIDYIAACSSGTIIAAGYAAGTLKELKKEFFSLNKKELLRLMTVANSTGGFLGLDKLDEKLLTYTKGMRLEDTKPHLAFVAVDLDSGEQIAISMGDMIQGIKASCSVPGIFEPTRMGGRNLADGGLVNLVPADVVRAMGADIVIAVDIAASRYIFSDRDIELFKRVLWVARGTGLPYTYLKRFLAYLRRTLLLGNFVQFYSQSDFMDEAEKRPGILQVIGKVIDISLKRRYTEVPFEKYANVIIEPKVKHHGRTEFGLLQASYAEGRKSARAAIPSIVKLIEDYKLGKEIPTLEPKLIQEISASQVHETKTS